MSADELRQARRRQPFQPFRLHTANGEHYDVPAPEWIMVLSRITALGVAGQSGEGEYIVWFNNEQITRLEPLA
jgi:hypothetical protein